jgi:hypothetical protein
MAVPLGPPPLKPPLAGLPRGLPAAGCPPTLTWRLSAGVTEIVAVASPPFPLAVVSWDGPPWAPRASMLTWVTPEGTVNVSDIPV